MNVNVMVVDDDAGIRKSIARFLEGEGCVVTQVSNGREALEALDTAHYDLVISDIVMPEMDGVELLREMRQRHPTVQTIVMTGFVKQANVLACMRLGAINCIFKPLKDLSELRESVEWAVKHINRWRLKIAYLQSWQPAEDEGNPEG